MGPSCLTRDQTPAPCLGRAESATGRRRQYPAVPPELLLLSPQGQLPKEEGQKKREKQTFFTPLLPFLVIFLQRLLFQSLKGMPFVYKEKLLTKLFKLKCNAQAMQLTHSKCT